MRGFRFRVQSALMPKPNPSQIKKAKRQNVTSKTESAPQNPNIHRFFDDALLKAGRLNFEHLLSMLTDGVTSADISKRKLVA